VRFSGISVCSRERAAWLSLDATISIGGGGGGIACARRKIAPKVTTQRKR
jgi:hypothetical protein